MENEPKSRNIFGTSKFVMVMESQSMTGWEKKLNQWSNRSTKNTWWMSDDRSG